jgi:hypothetical protein
MSKLEKKVVAESWPVTSASRSKKIVDIFWEKL